MSDAKRLNAPSLDDGRAVVGRVCLEELLDNC